MSTKRKPSERRSFQEAAQDLNLTPMMNLIGILIPVLLVSVAYVEIATLEATPPGDAEPTPPTMRQPLDVRVGISEAGYVVSGGPDLEPIAIPVVAQEVSCAQFVGTRPPPRQANRHRPRCTEAHQRRAFEVYDRKGLIAALASIKEEHPHERGLTLGADAEVEYEALVDVMDASRRHEGRPLFDQVRFGAPP